MSTLSIANSRNSKSAAPKKGSVKSNATSPRRATSTAATAKTPLKADEPKVGRVTKQERVLTLLSQLEGSSIEEMMQATDWQQHSVRGFLAGTVKRKLGFSQNAGAWVRRSRPRWAHGEYATEFRRIMISNKDLYPRRFDRKTASIWPTRTCHIGHTFSAKKESAEL